MDSTVSNRSHHPDMNDNLEALGSQNESLILYKQRLPSGLSVLGYLRLELERADKFEVPHMWSIHA